MLVCSQTSIPKEIFEQSFHLGGGHIGLFKDLLRFYLKATPKKIVPEKAVLDTAVQTRCQRILRYFNYKEQQILKTITLTQRIPESKETKYLQKAGLIKKTNEHVDVSIPILGEFVKVAPTHKKKDASLEAFSFLPKRGLPCT